MGQRRLSLTADCKRCAALCCVALAFDRSLGFGFDKAAGVPCPKLTDTDRCAVHDQRASLGLAGCIGYDCLGAGQRVTELFRGQSWRDSEHTARRMLGAFRALRTVHALIELLRASEALPLPSERRQARSRLLLSLERDPWTEESLARFEIDGLDRRVRAFLRGLAPFTDSKRRLPVWSRP